MGCGSLDERTVCHLHAATLRMNRVSTIRQLMVALLIRGGFTRICMRCVRALQIRRVTFCCLRATLASKDRAQSTAITARGLDLEGRAPHAETGLSAELQGVELASRSVPNVSVLSAHGRSILS
jgi:hypothetical protein